MHIKQMDRSINCLIDVEYVTKIYAGFLAGKKVKCPLFF